MQERSLFVWLIVSFGVFANTSEGQRAISFLSKEVPTKTTQTGDTAMLYEPSTCVGGPWPASSDEVVQWLLSPLPCDEDLLAAEPCVRQWLQQSQYLRAEHYRWRGALAQAFMGVLAFRRKDYAEALERFSLFRQLAVKEFGMSSKAVADAEICLGRVSFIRREYEQASFYYNSTPASLSLEALRSRPYLAQVWEDMLKICEGRGELACVYLTAKALAQFEPRCSPPDTLRWVSALVYAGAASERLASPQEAQEWLSHAQALMSVHPEAYRSYQVSALLTWARLKASEEVYSEAMRHVLRAEELHAENPHTSAVPAAEIWITAAEIALRQHAFGLAEQYIGRCEQTHGWGSNVRLSARAAIVKAQVEGEREQFDEAIQLLHKHLEVLQHLDFATPEKAALEEQLAWLYTAKGRLNAAEMHLSEARRSYQISLSEGHPNVLRACLGLSEIQVRRAATTEALQLVDSVITTLKSPANPTYSTRLQLLEALRTKARYLLLAYRSSGAESNLYKAQNAVQEGYRLVLQLRQAIGSIEQLTALHAHLERLTEVDLAIAYQQYTGSDERQRLEEAFKAAQQSKDFLWSPFLLQASDSSEARLIAIHKRLYFECLKENAQYWSEMNESTLDHLDHLLRQANSLCDASAAYRNFMDTLGWNYRSRLFSYTPVTANQIAAELRKKEALLDYFVGREFLYVFLIEHKGPLNVIEIPLHFSLSQRVDSLRSAIVTCTERMQMFYRPAYDLYSSIFQPVEQFLRRRVESIVIVPQGVLSEVPFEALLSSLPPPKKADQACNYKYLVSRYAISYAYSAKHWLSTRTVDIRRSGHRTYVLVSQDKQLKWGSKEAQNIRLILGAVPLSGALTKRELLDILPKAQIVHIVGHGSAAGDAMLYWGVALEDSTRHLYASEVLTLDIKARLVGLSACETALPSYYHPYGLSLARVFSYAGAATVLATDWLIPDNASQKIVKDFYALLRRPRTSSKAHALQEAQQNFLSRCENYMGHPYYWSGIRLYGNSLPFERPERRAIRRMVRQIKRQERLKDIQPR